MEFIKFGAVGDIMVVPQSRLVRFYLFKKTNHFHYTKSFALPIIGLIFSFTYLICRHVRIVFLWSGSITAMYPYYYDDFICESQIKL